MRMIYGTLEQEKTIRYWREIIKDHIGENVALDWVDKDFPDDQRIAVILPGLTGHSEQPYIRHIAKGLSDNNYRVLSFNPRGVGVPVETFKLFDYRDLLEEVEFVINYIYHKYP